MCTSRSAILFVAYIFEKVKKNLVDSKHTKNQKKKQGHIVLLRHKDFTLPGEILVIVRKAGLSEALVII